MVRLCFVDRTGQRKTGAIQEAGETIAESGNLARVPLTRLKSNEPASTFLPEYILFVCDNREPLNPVSLQYL